MRKIKNIILAVSVAAVTLSLYGCADKKNGSSYNSVVYYDSNNSYVNPNDQEEVLPTGEQNIEAQLGTKADIGNYSADFVKLVNLGTIGPDTVHPEKVNAYAAVFDITNNGDADMTVSALCNFHVLLEDGDIIYGTTSSSMFRAEDTLEDIPIFLNTKISSGETVTGFFPLEVPVDWNSFELHYFPEYDNGVYDSLIYKITPDMVVEP